MQPDIPANPTLLIEEQVRIFIGCLVVISNSLLLAFLNFRSNMRRRYIFFTLVCIGDIMDGSYLIYPSTMRIVQMAAGVFSGGTSLWGCASKGYMVFRIYGTELVSVSMLIMSLEKVFVVLFTFTYRRHATDPARFCIAIVCLLFCLISLATMFITSYLDSRTTVQEDKYCGISGSTTEGFAMFHGYFIIACQIGAFTSSAFAFLAARSLLKNEGSKEISSIKPILVISFISCIVVSSQSIVYLLKEFYEINITKTQQNYAVTYSPALFQVSKFALYVLSGREFREYLWIIVKNQADAVHAAVFFKRTSLRTRSMELTQ